MMEQIYLAVGQFFTWVVLMPFGALLLTFILWLLYTLAKYWVHSKIGRL